MLLQCEVSQGLLVALRLELLMSLRNLQLKPYKLLIYMCSKCCLFALKFKVFLFEVP